MIRIENTALFGIEYQIVCTNEEYYTLVNLTVDPEVVELKNYRRTPFASIVIKGEEIHDSIKINTRPDRPDFGTKDIKDAIIKIIEPVLKDSKLYVYNSYTDAEYDKYKKYFNGMNFHTVILFLDTSVQSDVSDKSILIGGFPIRGFISPIHKSPEYSLLNGAFVTTKMFSMKDIVLKEEPYMKHVYTDNDFLYYDKILYVYADIKIKFEIHEYKQLTEELGVVEDYVYSPEYISRIDTETKEEYYEFKIVNRIFNRHIPVSGREYLFQKPDKNIFHLSDIPNDIMMQKHMISKKI